MVAVPAELDVQAAKHAATLARVLGGLGGAASSQPQRQQLDVIGWAHTKYYIPQDSGRPRLIKLLPHQQTILRLFFDQAIAQAFGCDPNFQTLIYSTIKKSGKTAIAGLIARWITETWGSHVEVYSMANDLEQARGRIYAASVASVELDPRYDLGAKGIPGEWRIIEREAKYIPTHSSIRAVSSDYKGEAGSNPVATFWSELWGYSSEASQRLWEELTPVPTRPRSIRYVETYAGYEGESSILNDLEDKMKDPRQSRRLEIEELDDLGLEWPFDRRLKLPFFIHNQSRTIAYWDEGEEARRMPWQTSQYYQAQESDLRPNAFKRLHLNIRTSSTDEFIPIEWWERLKRNDLGDLLSDKTTPMVLAADGSVSGDCSAVAAVARDPKNRENVQHRGGRIWSPEPGRPLDYSVTIEPFLRYLCTGHIHSLNETCDNHRKIDVLGKCVPMKPLNVVELAYDEYQLHDLMMRIRNDGVWCRKFSQQAERAVADKALFDAIRDQRIHHNGDPDLKNHIRNCGAKIPKDDNTRLRIVKKAAKSKIDYAVALSMATHECFRLNLG